MTEQKLIQALNKYLRENSCYINKEFLDYHISDTGRITIYYSVNRSMHKKMRLLLSDLGFNSYAMNVYKPIETDGAYVPFKYLKEQINQRAERFLERV